ncbi:hypothetical protein HK100_012699, partial [Physocladia obscura]
MSIRIGVVALQGAFSEHVFMLQRIPEVKAAIEIRSALDFARLKDSIDGIVLPGGESTAMSILLDREPELRQALRQWVDDNKPIWGTCAGLIMLSNTILGSKQGGQTLIGGLKTTVRRNAFGRQVDSFEIPLSIPALEIYGANPQTGSLALPGVFIRAPVIESIEEGANIETIAVLRGKAGRDGELVAVRQGNVLGSSFHPELTGD